MTTGDLNVTVSVEQLAKEAATLRQLLAAKITECEALQAQLRVVRKQKTLPLSDDEIDQYRRQMDSHALHAKKTMQHCIDGIASRVSEDNKPIVKEVLEEAADFFAHEIQHVRDRGTNLLGMMGTGCKVYRFEQQGRVHRD